MAIEHLAGSMTNEQRIAALGAGRAGLKVAREKGAYAPEWDRLGRRYGIRLPQWHQEPTPARVRKWIGKLGISLAAYREWENGGTGDFQRLNPDWPLRSLVGMLLEEIDVGFIKSTLRVVCDEPQADSLEDEVPVEGHVVARRNGRRRAL